MLELCSCKYVNRLLYILESSVFEEMLERVSVMLTHFGSNICKPGGAL